MRGGSEARRDDGKLFKKWYADQEEKKESWKGVGLVGLGFKAYQSL